MNYFHKKINKINQQKIEKISIDASTSIIECLKKMDHVNIKLLIVYDNENFKGLISIGDIQRALLNQVSLNAKIKEVMRRENLIATPDYSREMLQKIFIETRAVFIPIIENNKVLNVIFWEDYFHSKDKNSYKKIDIPVVIMAGGLGLRMRPLTNILPKPLLPYKNSSILEHIIMYFQQAGCRTFYLCLNYKASMIRHYIDNHVELDVDIHYVEETSPMGTAGSLTLLNDKLQTSFFVSNCDILVDQDLNEFYNYHQQQMNRLSLIAALKHLDLPYGSLRTGEKGSILSLDEKPQMTFKINSGVYLLEPDTLQEIPKNCVFHMTDLIKILLKKKHSVGAFPVNEGDWTDLGDFNNYKKFVL